MDHTPQELEDLATMQDLLGRLRACAVAQVEACERMTVTETGPKTSLEMQRRSRAIRTTADLVVALYSPAPRRLSRAAIHPQSAARPPKPEPSPFMQSMDDIERSLQQIVSVQAALDDMPGGMEVPPALAEALHDLSQPSQGPAPLQNQAIALARFNKELTTAKALHRLKAKAVDAPHSATNPQAKAFDRRKFSP